MTISRFGAIGSVLWRFGCGGSNRFEKINRGSTRVCFVYIFSVADSRDNSKDVAPGACDISSEGQTHP